MMRGAMIELRGYSLTLADVKEAVGAHARRVDRRANGQVPGWFKAAVLGAFGLAMVVVFSVPPRGDGPWRDRLAVLLGAGLLYGYGFGQLYQAYASRRRFVRETWAGYNDPVRNSFGVRADESGVHSRSARGDSTTNWAAWVGMEETRGLLLLYVAAHNFHIVPKRAFADEAQRRAFMEMFDARAVNARKAGATFPARPAREAAVKPARVVREQFPYRVVDAFATTGACTGNPAAVVFLDYDEHEDLPDGQRQRLAAEFNLAETAFVRGLGEGRYELRWFTPTREVPLCGHATLGAAAALLDANRVTAATPVRFVTRESGELVCRFEGDEVVMDFPATPPTACEGPADAAAVLGVEGAVECIGSTAMNLTLRVESEAQVRRCRPDMGRIATWHPTGVTVTARADEAGVDFVSRFFAPQSGIPEDPVTGSAHCALAVYWAAQLGKTEFVARQLSARGGEIGVKLLGDRVELRGRGVVVMRGVVTL